ncbi:sulfatase [Cohnella zeiphila]|uniref:Sulfatase-like hydrolase/transferase n=1 Tax=Cohnella zeiphila TaxID=2761120 RepID=A0A7X0SP79_9BACL|nr:sulfatase-like hydrolase/transferase [Cohnella zeiphila]MBB6733633.1 sulfatase-like hydrolase/transferase [Cohnella zeiphila]
MSIGAAKSNDGKPNVLILFTDQQRHDTIQAAGNPHMITPNLDRSAAEGCLYTNAHSSNPVCMPARHDLLTGLPGRAHGYFTNNKTRPIKDYGLPTVARIFSENRYRTAAIGKMHFRPSRMHHGYGELILMEEIPNRRQDDQYATYLADQGLGSIQNIHGVRANLYHIPQQPQMEEAHHPNRWVADRAIDWLERNGREPFFLFCSWIHPHPPWAAPEAYRELYRDRELPQPVPVSRSYPFEPPGSVWYGDHEDERNIRRIREAYYACVTHVDYHIGRLLDHMREKRLLDDTLVIFASDHGDMLYDKGFFQKSLPYEGSARIPFIVRYPEKVRAGTVSDSFVDLLDVLPTCLDACGLSYPEAPFALPGASLFAEGAERDREHQICSFGEGKDRWVMARDRRYKYVYFYNRGTEQLFDMERDPQELHNLIGSGGEPLDAIRRLRIKAIDYERQWGPEGVIERDSFVLMDGGYSRTGAKYGNVQFHVMDEREPRARGEQFIRECELALRSEKDLKLNEICNESEYIEKFRQAWRPFAGEPVLKSIFLDVKNGTLP